MTTLQHNCSVQNKPNTFQHSIIRL